MQPNVSQIDRSHSGRRARVLTTATLRAADELGITRKNLAAVLGVSEAQVSRFYSGAATLNPASKTGELALLFVRLFRGLDSLVGSDERAARAWYTQNNRHLNGIPQELSKTAQGLVQVVSYVDAFRAQV